MQQCYLEGDLSDSTVDKSSLCHLACVGGKKKTQSSFRLRKKKLLTVLVFSENQQ